MKRIGLALSGGGIRAAIFHLGVLHYLADRKYFRNITSISSVSGASLCIGAIFAINGNTWPSEKDFLNHVKEDVRKLIIEKNIQASSLMQLPIHPAYWHNRVLLLSHMLTERWGITGNLQNLPPFPFWEINCTNFETGKPFRFRRDYMGDVSTGYVQKPTIPIADMIAASAAFPVLIGPYILNTDGMRFTKDKAGSQDEMPIKNHYALWDGGVYDNLGVEALHKIGKGLDKEIDFLIVSNASASIGTQERGRPSQNLKRLLDIAMSQVDALRAREFESTVVNRGHGRYIKIGHPAQDYPTTLNSPTPENFEMIFNHGYDCAKKALNH
ncbi:MAG: patatin-like phospholipase family protein [Defluviitaleaceae bacterium]|nr:patatin-like phospholipase family protein [Defluviitaleaceae bacterium]